MIQPDFGRIDPMPMAAFALFQQEINAGAGGPAFVLGDPRLAIPAAFGMGRKVQMGNDVVSCHGVSLAEIVTNGYGIPTKPD